jgi:8-oxo-dGTP diphosphatase
MRDRSTAHANVRRSVATSVDVVLCTPRGRHLEILLVRIHGRVHDGWALPHAPYGPGDTLERSATRVALQALGRRPAWLEQIGAFGGSTRHPTAASLSVGYVGVTPDGFVQSRDEARWFPVARLPALAPRHRAIADAALAALRDRMDHVPIAYRLVPSLFTLSALQRIYELLLGRPLHKASFRRALQASYLVKPTDEWQSEGRGRPARLFRYVSHRRGKLHRGLRFDLLGG